MKFKVEYWKIERLVPYERNARKLSAKAVSKVAESLKEFGWRQPIVVDSEDVVIAGHTRLLAAKSLGWEEAPVHVAGELTPAQVKAYRLMDNRAHDESDWDTGLLSGDFFDLKCESFDLELTGFEAPEIMRAVFGEFDLHSLDADELPPDDAKSRGGRSGKRENVAQSNAAEDPDALEFRVVVDCTSEEHQTELIGRFKAEGLKCRALIS